MQVIHHYNGIYPFSLQQESDKTYLQVLKENLSEDEINLYKKKYKIMKEMDQTNLLKLVKIYKEESKLHLLYQYLALSLEQYIQYRSKHFKNNQHQELKDIYLQFEETVNKIVEILVNFEIKTDITIQNFAVLSLQSFHLKLFVDPDAQIMHLNQQITHASQQANKKSANKLLLQEFYSAQKKRLKIQLDELLQKHFGKSYTVSSSNRPNFIIDGCKLVFLNNADPKKIDKQHKHHLINEITHKKQQINVQTRHDALDASPLRHQKTDKRDLKEKTMKKISQIKNVLNRYQNRQIYNNHEDIKPYPQKPDEIILRNEMTADKTSFEEQNQYLDSLQKQLQQSAQQKKKRRQSEQKRADIIKQLNQLQEKNRGQPSERSSDLKGLQRERHSLKDVKFFMNKEDTDKSRNSDDLAIRNEQKKEEKPNKYKMKITTSHQIEIQGKGQPQMKQVQKESIENMKAGKISASQIPQKSQRPKTFKVENEQQTEMHAENNLKIGSRNSDIASKSKKINEIIQKINSKSKSNFNHNHNNTQQNQAETGEQKNIEEVQHTTDSYYNKIRDAKHKAQQVLKQYAKKKQ